MKKILEVGQVIKKGWGFYNNQIACSNNLKHKIMWWYQGAFCLDEYKYVRPVIDSSEYEE